MGGRVAHANVPKCRAFCVLDLLVVPCVRQCCLEHCHVPSSVAGEFDGSACTLQVTLEGLVVCRPRAQKRLSGPSLHSLSALRYVCCIALQCSLIKHSVLQPPWLVCGTLMLHVSQLK